MLGKHQARAPPPSRGEPEGFFGGGHDMIGVRFMSYQVRHTRGYAESCIHSNTKGFNLNEASIALHNDSPGFESCEPTHHTPQPTGDRTGATIYSP